MSNDKALATYHPGKAPAKASVTTIAKREPVAQAKDVDRPHVIMVEPPNGYVIKFALKFRTGPQVYNYAALKVGGRWFTTGRTCPPSGYSWAGLCEFIDGEDLHGLPTIWDGR